MTTEPKSKPRQRLKPPIQYYPSFPSDVSWLVEKAKISVTDAVLLWCELKDEDPTVGAEHVRKFTTIRQAIEKEALGLHQIRPVRRLRRRRPIQITASLAA